MRVPRWCAVVLLVVPLPLSAGCGDGDPSSCESRVSKRLEVEPVDAPLRFHLERCRLDIDACPQLCQVALSRIGLQHTVQSCTVGFVGEAALLDVEYTVFNFDDNDCFFDQPFPGDDVRFKRGAR